MEENTLEVGTLAKRRQNALNRGEKLVPCTCQTFGRPDGVPHHVTQRVRRAHQKLDVDEPRNKTATSHQVIQYHNSPPPLLDDEMDVWNDNEELSGHDVNAFSEHKGLAMNLYKLSTDSGGSADGEFSNLNDDAFSNDIDEVDSTDNETCNIEDYPELYYRPGSLSSGDEVTNSETSEDSFGYEYCEGMCLSSIPRVPCQAN
jgi:hypothetical protein